jgi:hypothetical protein
VAGKSTLNRLELSRPQPSRYHKIAHDPVAIEGLFVTLFLEAHEEPPAEIILQGQGAQEVRVRRQGQHRRDQPERLRPRHDGAAGQSL